MFRGETESVTGTYVELKENNKKIAHRPTTPKKKKSLDPLDAWPAGIIGRPEFLCFICFV